MDEIPVRFRSALNLLLEASDYAERLQRDIWDFAVEVKCLHDMGLTTSDLRWIHHGGLIEHGHEMTQPRDRRRKFSRTATFGIGINTCLVLTDAGREACRAMQPMCDDVIPQWDDCRRELRWGRMVVKRYRLPSRNQSTVLSAFEEDGWPPRIDDPLPPVGDVDPKRRLNDTVKSLNRKQLCPAIRFMGDGSGAGVLWKPTPLRQTA